MAAPSTPYTATIRQREAAGGGLTRVVLAAPAEVLATYKRPGQYLVVDTGSKDGPSYFVLACAVEATEPELLLRGGGDVADLLTGAPLGTAIQLSAAQGAGFPCAEAKGAPLLVAVAGTGIAAARAIVAWRVADGDARRTEVFVGVRTIADVAVADELRAWRAAGMEVTVCVSREPSPDAAALGGEVRVVPGYVQAAIETGVNLPDRRGARLFAVGPDAMIAELRRLTAAIGIAERDLHTNY